MPEPANTEGPRGQAAWPLGVRRLRHGLLESGLRFAEEHALRVEEHRAAGPVGAVARPGDGVAVSGLVRVFLLAGAGVPEQGPLAATGLDLLVFGEGQRVAGRRAAFVGAGDHEEAEAADADYRALLHRWVNPS